MQHGDSPVKPDGHMLPGGPPKQRGMPERSSLHASSPPQQFIDALIISEPPSVNCARPQMLPTPLQAWPLSQRPFVQSTLPFGLTPPPQHWLLFVHQVPVSRQPPAGKQTVAPVPGSKQVLEQHPEPPLHGLPS